MYKTKDAPFASSRIANGTANLLDYKTVLTAIVGAYYNEVSELQTSLCSVGFKPTIEFDDLVQEMETRLAAIPVSES